MDRRASDVLVLAACSVDLERGLATRGDGSVRLTTREVELLRFLVARAGEVVTREQLLGEVWGYADTVLSRACDNAVRRLRTKVEADPSNPVHVLTVHGEGYRFVSLSPTPSVRAPAPADALVGRVEALERVLSALDVSSWVVLTGPGGIGKTRLAQEVAATSTQPVCWVDCVGADNTAGLVEVVATALGLAGRVDVERVGTALARRGPLLLVLDNLEQVVTDATEPIGVWRAGGPQLRTLGTSRVPLGLDGEREVALDPMTVDEGEALFLRRAAGVSGGDPAVRQLVERLDGLPLAIELAAARSVVLTPDQVLERMDRALDLLARPRAADPRHRSLRSCIQGSWELLDLPAREALALLGLFVDGFALEDAESLLGPEAVQRLQTLREHGLIHRRDRAQPFGVAEAVRLFVAERREEGLVRRWVAGLASLGEPDRVRVLHLDGQERARGRVELHLRDLERAAALALERRWGGLAGRCLLAATWMRERVGGPGQAWRLLPTVLEAGLEPTVAASLGVMGGRLARVVDRPEVAVSMGRQAARLASAHQLDALEGEAWLVVQSALGDLSDPVEAEAAAVAAVEAFARAGAEADAAWARSRVAWYRRDGAEVIRWLERTVEHALAGGDGELAAIARYQLARFDRANQRLQLARRRLEQALAVQRRSARLPPLVSTLQQLALVLLELGDPESVDEVAAEAVEASIRLGSPVEEATSLGYLASAQLVRGDLADARASLRRAYVALETARDVPRTRGYLEVRDAQLMLALGDPASALQLARAARDRFRSLPDAWNEARANGVRALAESALGHHDVAERLADEAVRALVDADHPDEIAIALCQRGQVALTAGRRAQAEGDLGEAIQQARRAGSQPGSEALEAIRALERALG